MEISCSTMTRTITNNHFPRRKIYTREEIIIICTACLRKNRQGIRFDSIIVRKFRFERELIYRARRMLIEDRLCQTAYTNLIFVWCSDGGFKSMIRFICGEGRRVASRQPPNECVPVVYDFSIPPFASNCP